MQVNFQTEERVAEKHNLDHKIFQITLSRDMKNWNQELAEGASFPFVYVQWEISFIEFPFCMCNEKYNSLNHTWNSKRLPSKWTIDIMEDSIIC